MIFKKIKNFFKGTGTRFPDKMPADFKIEINSGGTFIRGGSTILIAENGFRINTFIKDQKQEYRTSSFSRIYLEKLFHLLKVEKFDRIKIREVLRYDYPSFGISASWGNKRIDKGESQTEEMKESDYEIFHRCEFYLHKIIEEALKEETRIIQVIPEGSFLDETNGNFQLNSIGRLFSYYYNNRYLSNRSDNNNEFPDQLTVLPGYTTLFIYWKSNLHYEFARPQFIIPIPYELNFKILYIYKEGEMLKWKFE